MKVEIINKRTQELICQADIDFGLETYIINSVQGITEEELECFLEEHSLLPCTYEIDEIILKRLNLYSRKNLFGRMSEAKILYALLNNFESDKDDYILYPTENTYICLHALDCRYSNIYIFNKEKKEWS